MNEFAGGIKLIKSNIVGYGIEIIESRLGPDYFNHRGVLLGFGVSHHSTIIDGFFATGYTLEQIQKLLLSFISFDIDQVSRG